MKIKKRLVDRTRHTFTGDTTMGTFNSDRITFDSAEKWVNTRSQDQPIPFLWFDDNTEEALYFFVSEFNAGTNMRLNP
jgi:hypothetical protein